MSTQLELGPLDTTVRSRLEHWRNDNVVTRFWEKDTSLWSPDPGVPELGDRLGWLDLPQRSATILDEVERFGREIAEDRFTDVVLLGMGGSSLAPEVFQETFGNADGYPRLTVLDSTHPDAVGALRDALDLERTLFFVSSKSGGTIETMSFYAFFWDAFSVRSEWAGRHFVAITDPGTSLEALAQDRGFRHVFHAPADVGGRYSALSVFGLAPAAAIGVDVRALVETAKPLGAPAVFTVPVEDNPGMALGAVLGEAALAGRDKLTIHATPALTAFPAWIEQLVAESTGKDGRGIVPVLHEPVLAPARYGADRLFVSIELDGEAAPDLTALTAAGHPVVRIRLDERAQLGREFYRWEVATAAAGMILGIQPFDQPDVQLAKDLARRAMQGGADAAVADAASADLPDALRGFLASAGADDYISIHAYLPPDPSTRAEVAAIAASLRDATSLPVTFEFGPRFLHSTGQLHKGGAGNGLFLQVVDHPEADMAVPTTDYTFDRLIAAQSAGDAAALTQRGRRLLRVVVGEEIALADVRDAIAAAG